MSIVSDSEPLYPVSKAEKLVGDTNDDLFSVFDECVNYYPHLLIEIGYNRVVDWMVTVWNAAGCGIKAAPIVISTQSYSRDDAFAAAITQLREKYLPENC